MANEEHLAILRQGVEVWNQWRQDNPQIFADLSDMFLYGAELIGANLSGSNLSGTNLSNASLCDAVMSLAFLNGANLINSDLRDADLSDANLIDTDFTRANLNRADLSGADLSGASLKGANLRDAILSHTDLKGTYLRSTYLRSADFSNTDIGGTVFADVDLSEVKALETARHLGPSSISIDTIYKSKGQIPEIFLRGCGVPDIFIEYMHALTAKPFEFYSCFISYSHADAAFAQRLHDTLQGKGVRCWLDEKDARLGVPITHNIESGIRLTDKFLLCCSKESLGSNWVNFEIDLALHRETELRQETAGNPWRIIPLDLDGHLFSSEYSGEALRIRNRLAGDFTGWKTDSDKFDRQIARVMQAIRIESGEK